MSIAFQLDNLDNVDESLRGLYEESEGSFQLKVEGLPEQEDTTALKNAKEHEKQARLAAEKQLKTIEKEKQDAVDEKARASGDVEALEKSWNDKHTNALSEKDIEIEKRDSTIYRLTVESAAKTMATDIAGDDAAIMLPHIKSRLKVEFKDGDYVTAVLDVNGRPSALTIQELTSEFKANPTFKNIVNAHQASGDGATESHGGSESVTELNASSSIQEKIAFHKSKLKASQETHNVFS